MSKFIKVEGVKVGKYGLYVNPDRTLLRVGAKGAMSFHATRLNDVNFNPTFHGGKTSKGVRRLIRKALRENGHIDAVLQSVGR